MARHHLYHLIGRQPLKWDEMIPPPVVAPGLAREAVISVVKTVASLQGEGVWAECEKAFVEDLDVQWRSLGTEGIHSTIIATFKCSMGRDWSQSSRGETVTIELE